MAPLADNPLATGCPVWVTGSVVSSSSDRYSLVRIFRVCRRPARWVMTHYISFYRIRSEIGSRARRWGNAPRRQTRHELEYLQVHPHCLMFFVDDTGQEEFADSKFPVFGMVGCAIPAAAIDQNLRQPYRAVAADHSVRIRQQGYSALDANKYPDPPSSNVRIECVLLD
jgi:hypothetical protein